MIGFLNKNSVTSLYFGVVFVLLIIVGFCLKQKPTEFMGFGLLVPSSDALCSEIKLPAPDVTSKLAWPTMASEPCEYTVELVEPFRYSESKFISFSFSGSGKVIVYINGGPHRVEINDSQYRDVYFKLEGNEPLAELRIKIKRVSGALFVRDRVEFLSNAFPVVRLVTKHLNALGYYQIAIISILSFMFLFRVVFAELSKFPYITSSLLGVVFFLSPKLFYYFDEWHILERFSKLGFSGVIHTHNEHSIIAFFVWYYALVNFFGENYFALLIVSILLHVACALSLENLMLTYNFDRRAIRASSVFFMFSCLHVEVLHWAFEQSIILSCLSGLWGLIYLRKWIQSSHILNLLMSGLFLLLSPLLFGNGFIFFPLALFLIFVEFGLVNVKRYIYPSISLAISALIPVLIYHSLKNVSGGHGVNDIKGEFSMGSFIGYLVTGSGLGTIGRGLGFYPNLTLSSVQTFCYEVFGHYVPWIDRRVMFDAAVESSLGTYLWFFLLIVMTAIFYFRKEVRFFIPASLVGLVLLLLSFLLPAIGRTHLGALQSLSLRYQYSAMLGLSILLCPLFYVFLRTTASRYIFFFVGSLWMFEQAYLSQSFTYFTDHGNLHRVYVEELLDWDDKEMHGDDSRYEGTDEKRGVFPLVRSSITPGTPPAGILKIAKWLRGE